MQKEGRNSAGDSVPCSAKVMPRYRAWSPAPTGAATSGTSEVPTKTKFLRRTQLCRPGAAGDLLLMLGWWSPCLQKVCTSGGSVSPSKEALGGGPVQLWSWQKGEWMDLLWDPADKIAQTCNFTKRGTGWVLLRGLGNKRHLWQQRLESGDLHYQEEDCCSTHRPVPSEQSQCTGSRQEAGSCVPWSTWAVWAWTTQDHQKEAMSDSSGWLPAVGKRGPHLPTWSII